MSPAAPDDEVEKTVTSLIEVFRHPEARSARLEDSRRAITALAAIGKPALPKLLDAILAKADDAAGYAALALKEMPAKEAVEGVTDRWNRVGTPDRWKLVPHFVRHDFDAVAKFALACLDDKDVQARGPAWSFVIVNAKEKAVAPAKDRYLKALAGDEVPTLRWGLLAGSPVFDAEKEADILIGLLKPESWAAKGEGRVPPPGFAPPWWPDGRDGVVGVLGQRGVKRAVPAMIELLAEKGSGKGFLGHAIIPLLGEFGDKAAIPELKSILTAKPDKLLPGQAEPRHQMEAARSLLQLGDRTGRPLLIEHLKAEQWFNRRFAADAFARFGTKDDLALFAGMLDDDDWGVRRSASEGLERLTGVQNRGGRTRPSEYDAPLWKEWLKKNP